MAQKKYDYVFAPPLLPGLLAAAPMAMAMSQNSSEPQKYERDKIFFLQNFYISGQKRQRKIILVLKLSLLHQKKIKGLPNK